MDPSGGMLGVAVVHPSGADVFNVPGSLTWNELWRRAISPRHCRSTKGVRLDLDRRQFARLQGRPTCFKTRGRQRPAQGPRTCRRTCRRCPPFWLVYFAVNDVPGTVEDALALGGKIFVQPRQTDTSVVAGILDPNGGRFMIVSGT